MAESELKIKTAGSVAEWVIESVKFPIEGGAAVGQRIYWGIPYFDSMEATPDPDWGVLKNALVFPDIAAAQEFTERTNWHIATAVRPVLKSDAQVRDAVHSLPLETKPTEPLLQAEQFVIEERTISGLGGTPFGTGKFWGLPPHEPELMDGPRWSTLGNAMLFNTRAFAICFISENHLGDDNVRVITKSHAIARGVGFPEVKAPAPSKMKLPKQVVSPTMPSEHWVLEMIGHSALSNSIIGRNKFWGITSDSADRTPCPTELGSAMLFNGKAFADHFVKVNHLENKMRVVTLSSARARYNDLKRNEVNCLVAEKQVVPSIPNPPPPPSKKDPDVELGAILWKKWETSALKKDRILGYWGEDDTVYNITVPPQLRNMIIKMQNVLCNGYCNVIEMRKGLKAAEDRFGALFTIKRGK